MSSIARIVRPELWGACLLLLWPGAASAARALPFEPLPSAFQQWLNQRQSWPAGPRPRFSELASCSDKTTIHSPFGQASFTCLVGHVSFSQPSGQVKHCALSRVSFYPASGDVRYWTRHCR